MRIAHISDIHALSTTAFHSRFRSLLESILNEYRFTSAKELNRSNVELILHGNWHVTEAYPVSDGTLRAINGAGVFQQGTTGGVSLRLLKTVYSMKVYNTEIYIVNISQTIKSC